MPTKTQTVSNEPVEVQKPNRVIVFLMILLLLMSIIAIIALLVTINPQEQIIRNLFVDVNGDGRVDYIKNAIVIFNSESVKNFP